MTNQTIPPVIKISGVEFNNKNFVSVILNKLTNEYNVAYNMYFKTIGAQVFDIDGDYDFGSINPIDLIVEIFNDASLSYSGISRKQIKV